MKNTIVITAEALEKIYQDKINELNFGSVLNRQIQEMIMDECRRSMKFDVSTPLADRFNANSTKVGTFMLESKDEEKIQDIIKTGEVKRLSTILSMSKFMNEEAHKTYNSASDIATKLENESRMNFKQNCKKVTSLSKDAIDTLELAMQSYGSIPSHIKRQISTKTLEKYLDLRFKNDDDFMVALQANKEFLQAIQPHIDKMANEFKCKEVLIDNEKSIQYKPEIVQSTESEKDIRKDIINRILNIAPEKTAGVCSIF